MKLQLALFNAAIFFFSITVAHADYNVLRNDVTWPTTFEGDFLPEFADPVWDVFDENNFASRTTDGAIYSIVSGSTGVASSYQIQDASWNSGTATRTVEFRARVPNADFLALDGAASIILGINGAAYDFRLYPDKLAYNGAQTGGGVLDPANIVNLDMTQFHTFRVTVDQNAATVVNLYVDNNPVPALSTNDFWFTSPGFDKLVFGDISTGGQSGRSDWDFISWDGTAAIGFGVPGDFDGDGDVDGSDFLIWQRGDSPGGPLSPQDLQDWQNNYSPLVAAVGAVPEPGSLILVMASFCTFAFLRKKSLG